MTEGRPVPRAEPPWRTWRTATQTALYGPQGFFTAGAGPAAHFRTSVHASPLFARALLALLRQVDDALAHPDPILIVDVAAGDGELLARLAPLLDTALAGRAELVAVETRTRPAGLDHSVRWTDTVPEGVVGLLVANEWLDNVPVDVVQVVDGELRLLEVDPASGQERAGAHPSSRDTDWVTRWWPLARAADGHRAEVGRPRDDAWAEAVGRLRAGLALAVDYGHLLDERRTGRYAHGTLVGYREGRQVDPLPDGSCDLTSHVALDAVAQAGQDAGAEQSHLTTQRQALQSLGMTAHRPSAALADIEPRAYLDALQEAGEAAELVEASGLGGFGWLIQTRGMAIPPALRDTAAYGTSG